MSIIYETVVRSFGRFQVPTRSPRTSEEATLVAINGVLYRSTTVHEHATRGPLDSAPDIYVTIKTADDQETCAAIVRETAARVAEVLERHHCEAEVLVRLICIGQPGFASITLDGKGKEIESINA